MIVGHFVGRVAGVVLFSRPARIWVFSFPSSFLERLCFDRTLVVGRDLISGLSGSFALFLDISSSGVGGIGQWATELKKVGSSWDQVPGRVLFVFRCFLDSVCACAVL